MPFPHSKSLNATEVYAVTAYVLNLNDIVDADFIANSETLPAVKMPNRDGYMLFPGLMEIHGKSDVHNTACMENCEATVVVIGQLPKGYTESIYGDISDNFRGLAIMNETSSKIDEKVNGRDSVTDFELTKKYGCVTCHDLNQNLIGPAFRAVADKYAGQKGAIAHLRKKIRNGGVGVWGNTPMPPQPDPSDAELEILVRWILGSTLREGH